MGSIILFPRRIAPIRAKRGECRVILSPNISPGRDVTTQNPPPSGIAFPVCGSLLRGPGFYRLEYRLVKVLSADNDGPLEALYEAVDREEADRLAARAADKARRLEAYRSRRCLESY